MSDWFFQEWLFASDATELAFLAALLFVLGGLALLADIRRGKRKNIDAVGFMPWMAIFLACGFCGVALMTLAVKGWIAG